MVATVFVRREEPGGDAIVPLSGGTVDGLLQPFTGRRAEAQAGGVTGGDGESPEPNRQRSGAPQAEAVDGDGDCFEGRPSAGALQDGQTLPAHDRGWQVELVTAGGDDCPGSAAGWPALQRGCTWNYADGGALRALSEDYRKQILATVRSPSLGTPEEIAAMVAFLFSDDGAYVNGQPILVDGGANFN